jgi:hypothetical protein
VPHTIPTAPAPLGCPGRHAPTCSSGTWTKRSDMRSPSQKSSLSTVSSAKSQILASHSTRARHFLEFPGRRTCTVVALDTWRTPAARHRYRRAGGACTRGSFDALLPCEMPGLVLSCTGKQRCQVSASQVHRAAMTRVCPGTGSTAEPTTCALVMIHRLSVSMTNAEPLVERCGLICLHARTSAGSSDKHEAQSKLCWLLLSCACGSAAHQGCA